MVLKAENRIIGVAPLAIRERYGIRFAKPLIKSWFSRDFIIEDNLNDVFMQHLLDFLFRTLGCQIASLDFQSDSKNLETLEKLCRTGRIHVLRNSEMGHDVLSISHSWEEYQRLRGKNFRRELRRLDRDLTRAGEWRIVSTNGENDRFDVLDRILNVEKNSWKEAWRARASRSVDEDLLAVWKGSRIAAKTNHDFGSKVWFLELNGKAIAYSLVLYYKQKGFFVKTSYDKRFGELSPGICVLSAVVHDFFAKREKSFVDFLTHLPFQERWNPVYLPQTRVTLWKETLLNRIFSFVLRAVFSNRARTLLEIVSRRLQILNPLE